MSSYCTGMMFNMNELRTNSIMTDFTIVNFNGNVTTEYKLHKVTLSCASMYFRCLFNSNMKESQECKVTFNYSQLNMDSVIDFIYSGILIITEGNVMEITEISSYLQIKTLIEKCNSFLSEYLPKNPRSNLLDIIYKYDLSLTVNNFIEKIKKDFNIIFEERIEKYVFLRLTTDELHELLKLRSFNSTDEYYFVKGIRVWLKYAITNRLDNAQSLFNLINCRSCSKIIMLENKIINSGNCKVDEIIKQLHLNIYFLNDPTAVDLLNSYKVQSIDSFNIPPNVIKQPNISIKKPNISIPIPKPVIQHNTCYNCREYYYP